jgi:hypothetical protein
MSISAVSLRSAPPQGCTGYGIVANHRC